MEESEVVYQSDEETVEYEIEVVTSASSVSLAGPLQSTDDQMPEYQPDDEQETHKTKEDQANRSQEPPVSHENGEREESNDKTRIALSRTDSCVKSNQIGLNQQLADTNRGSLNASEINDRAKNREIDVEPLVTNKPTDFDDSDRLALKRVVAQEEPTDSYGAQNENHDLDDNLDNHQKDGLSKLPASNAHLIELNNRDNTDPAISGLNETGKLVHDNIPEGSDLVRDRTQIAIDNLLPKPIDVQASGLVESSVEQQEVPKFCDLSEKEEEVLEQDEGRAKQRIDLDNITLDVQQELPPTIVDLSASEEDKNKASEQQHSLESHQECQQRELVIASATAPPTTLSELNQSASNDSLQTHQPLGTEQTSTTAATKATTPDSSAAGDDGQATTKTVEVTRPTETVTDDKDNVVATGQTESGSIGAPATDAIGATGGREPVMDLIECQLVGEKPDDSAERPVEEPEQLQIERVQLESTSLNGGEQTETGAESGSTNVADGLANYQVSSAEHSKDNESGQSMNSGENNSVPLNEPRSVSRIETTDCDVGKHSEPTLDDTPRRDTFLSSIDISVELVPTAPQVILSLGESATGDHESSRLPLLMDKGYKINWDDNERGAASDGDEDMAEIGNYSPSSESNSRVMHSLRLEDDNFFVDDYDDSDDLEREFDEEPEFESRNVVVKRNRDPRDEYELGTELGRGRFGTVFKCTEMATGRQLAAKFISMRRREDREDVEREVAIMSILQHRRLLQLYDAFDEGPQEMCLITELVEGGELFERIVDDDFDLTEKKAAVFMRQICEGVEYMHSKQIVHLDMKPENILCLSRTGYRIKLIDFGLARRLDPLKPIRVMFGTPDFAAPEVLGYETVTLATDMWSVGVICYVLLSGLSPFMGENDMDTMANVTRATYDFNDQAFEPISELAKDFIAKLLVRNPEKRLKPAECLKHAWLQRGGAKLEAAVRERRESTSVLHRLAMEQAVAAAALATSTATADMSPPVFGQQQQQQLHRASFGAESTTSSGLVSLDKRRLKRYVVRRKWHRMVHAIMALNRMGANLVFK